MTVTDGDLLTTQNIPAYLAPYLDKQLEGVFPNDATLRATAIQGGNVNYAFCVTCEQDETAKVFVKQAPEYVAVFGPDGFPLTSQRMQQEMDVYAEWNKLLDTKKATKYLPTIYFFDRSKMVVCMEFFDGFQLLDHVLVENAGSYHPDVAAGLGEFMGATHAATHSSRIDAQRKAYLVRHYENRPMRDIQLDFVFTKCYQESTPEQRAGLDMTDEFIQQVEQLKQNYDGKNTDSLVLSHGDLHPGSVMVHPNGQVKVIDPEFTVYGPPGLDVGSLLSGYCLGAIHQAFCDHPDAVARIVQGAQAIWDSYVAAMQRGGIQDEALIRQIEIEAVGFTVAEVCRTALEFAGGRKWLQFEDPDVKAAAKKAALKLVEKCMIGRHGGGIRLLLDELTAASKK